MAIILGGKPVDINDIIKKENTIQPVQKVESVKPIQKVEPVESVKPQFVPPKRIIQSNKPPQIVDGNTLVVNGKSKTIGKKSQYLLDMMIIDDE
jgi:hypothetical protein